MTGDDLKLVVLRYVDDIDHCVVHDVADRLNDFRRCCLGEIDSNEWHGLTLGLSGEWRSAGYDLRDVLEDSAVAQFSKSRSGGKFLPRKLSIQESEMPSH